jgi:hypothetical protein
MPKPSKIEPVLIQPEEWLKSSSSPLGSQEGHHFGVDCVVIRYSTDVIGEGPNLHVHPVAKLQKDWKPIRFPVSDVHLIAREDPPNDSFEIVETVALGRDV